MRIFKRIFKEQRNRNVPLCVFCYHKVGTVLLSRVFRQICQERNWKFQIMRGKQKQLPKDSDIILFIHSLINPSDITTPFIGLHVIRDPRDIIVSGYQYHCRTSEKWCINTDFTSKPPIKFPQVPYSQQHRPEDWKIGYLESLNARSYQQNLLSMSRRDGLLFELHNYGTWTIESVKDWDYNNDNILEVKFEDLMNDFNNVFRLIFEHFVFSKSEINIGINVASQHNLGNKSAEEIEKMPHVTSIKTSRWKDHFEAVHKEAFKDKFGNVLVELGYEKNNNW